MTELPPLRKNTRFQLLWTGSAVSQLGMELTRLAMPLLVLALTGSAGWAGLVAGARIASSVLAQIPAGVWVDRWDRRRTLVTSQALQTLNSTVLAVLVVAGQARMWHFVVIAAVDGVCVAFVGPARMTAIRGVVPVAQLRGAFALEESRSHAARLAGPPLGGLLYGLGRAIPFVVDAVTFLVAMLCSLFAKVPRRPGDESRAASAPGNDDQPAQAGQRRKRSMRRDAGEAFAWLWQQRGLRAVCAVLTLLNLLGGMFQLPLIVLVGNRGGNAFNTGAVLAGIGVGGLVGALVSGRLGNLLPPGKIVLSVLTIFGTALVSMTLPLGPWWPVVPLICISLSTPTLNVVLNVVITRMVPEHLLGRMDSVLTVASFGLAPVAPVLGGVLAATLGGAVTLGLIGGLILLTAVGAALSHELRDFTGETEPDQPDDAAADAVPKSATAEPG